MAKLVDLYDWTNECATCGRPDLLQKGACTRENIDSPEDLVKIWTEFKKRMRSNVRWAKCDRSRERKNRILCLKGSRN